MCSDVRVCTSMCPLNQDKKSAVKVYTGMYSVHASIYFIWEFHTEIYRHILSYTYNCISRHIPLVKSISRCIRRYTFGQSYTSRYTEYILRYMIFILSFTVASYNSWCTDSLLLQSISDPSSICSGGGVAILVIGTRCVAEPWPGGAGIVAGWNSSSIRMSKET